MVKLRILKCRFKRFAKGVDHRVYLAVFLIAVILILLLLTRTCGQNWFDRRMTAGPWEGKSEEQIQADLNAQVAEGEMNVSISTCIKFEAGSTSGVAHIENIEANHVDQKVEIVLSDGRLVYESGAIAPGYCINNIEINEPLNSGVYPATAIFTGYEQQSHEQRGKVAAQVNLYVS